MQRLTDRQKQVLDAIIEHIKTEGRPPTFRELGKQVGIRSPNGVTLHINALRRKGYLKPRTNSARMLQPAINGCCPLCGAIATENLQS